MEGSSFQCIRDDRAPLQSELTKMIIAARTCGAKWWNGGKSAFHYGVSEAGKIEVQWTFDAAKCMSFRLPDGEMETIDFAEFWRRWESDAWIEANPDHPIAYLKVFCATMHAMRAYRVEQKPSLVLRKGKRVANIPAEASDEEREKIMRKFR